MVIEICIGSSCHLKGTYNIIQTLQHILEERKLYDRVNMKSAFCMKNCGGNGVSVSVNGTVYGVTPENVVDFFDNTIIPLLNVEDKA